MAKTTEEDYKHFKKCCKKWVAMFGLLDYNVEYSHNGDEDSYANTNWTMPGRQMTVKLSKDWGNTAITKESIDRTAFHEIMEILLVNLRYLCEARNITASNLDSEVHAVINRLENVFFDG